MVAAIFLLPVSYGRTPLALAGFLVNWTRRDAVACLDAVVAPSTELVASFLLLADRCSRQRHRRRPVVDISAALASVVLPRMLPRSSRYDTTAND